MPTILEATGAAYPARLNGRDIIPFEGRSLLPALRGKTSPDGTLYWEHTGNAAIRRGPVEARPRLSRGAVGTSTTVLAQDRRSSTTSRAQNPALVRELARDWQAWADRVGVMPWPVTEAIYAERGQPPREAMG